MSSEYILKGNRKGFDLHGLRRVDDADGYSRFLRPNGTAQAVVKTCFLVDVPD